MTFSENKVHDSGQYRSVTTADAVLRAAHVRIRKLCLTEQQEPDERLEMACGLIAGLRDRLDVDPRIRDLVAYVYELMDGEGAGLLATSRALLEKSFAARNLPAFTNGLSEARKIVETIEHHKRKR